MLLTIQKAGFKPAFCMVDGIVGLNFFYNYSHLIGTQFALKINDALNKCNVKKYKNGLCTLSNGQ